MKTVPANLLIAVVDDDESIRCSTASLLRSEGYVTESFDSAENFLESADCRRFACVVADIQMPGMSGIELANKLSQSEPPTPVILVTARTERDVLVGATETKATCLLRKPFAAERLLECLRSALVR